MKCNIFTLTKCAMCASLIAAE